MPEITGLYRHQPVYTFPEFNNYKYKKGSDWEPIKELQLKCLAIKRKLCLSVHIFRKDRSCPKYCFRDTMIIRNEFDISDSIDDYVTDIDYFSDVLKDMTVKIPQRRMVRPVINATIFDFPGLAYANVSNFPVEHLIYFFREKRYRKSCSPCNLYHNIEVPIRNSSYLMDTTPQYLDSMEPTNPKIHINRTQGISSEISYQTQHHQYHVSSLVNASWLSAYDMCGERNQSLLTMAQEEIAHILTDLYSTVNIWAFRKALPILAFLGIQSTSEKVSFCIFGTMLLNLVINAIPLNNGEKL